MDNLRMPWRSRDFSGFVGALTVAVLLGGCHRGPATVMAELDEARHLAADARVQFSKGADASNRAVMADTDEASVSNAHEARQATKRVEHDIAVLVPLLKSLGVANEVVVILRFEKQFSEYHAVDENILDLAVENTNLKAQQLSFGPAREAADHIESSLAQVLPSLSASEQCRTRDLAVGAVLNVRKIQTLHAPHIASADDAAMTRMEQDISALELKTANALADLKGLVDPSALSAAHSAFDQVRALDSQIVALSRKNTNVRSLDLSLRVKPALTNACDDTLRTLQSELANEGSKATR